MGPDMESADAAVGGHFYFFPEVFFETMKGMKNMKGESLRVKVDPPSGLFISS
jgi:hypothetical protein